MTCMPPLSTARRTRSSRLEFPQAPCLHVEHEPPHSVCIQEKGALLQHLDRFAEVLVQVVERVCLEWRRFSGVLFEAFCELVVAEALHAAVRVLDQDDLLGSEQVL